MTTSLVVTVVGPDRPGIVNQLSDAAQRVGANWEASRMANLAGQFAGIVHLDVPVENADALANALSALESTGLRVVIARSDALAAPAGRRAIKLELAGPDRPGIVAAEVLKFARCSTLGRAGSGAISLAEGAKAPLPYARGATR